MRKILILFVVFVLTVSSSLCVYADEISPDPEASAEGSGEILEPHPEPEPEPQPEPEPETPSEPSEMPSEPSEEPEASVEPEQPENAGEMNIEPSEPLEPETPTVNVSQESIDAIARAVSNNNSYQIIINNVVYSIIDDSSYDDLDYFPNIQEMIDNSAYWYIVATSPTSSVFYMNFHYSEPTFEKSAVSSNYFMSTSGVAGAYKLILNKSSNTFSIRENMGVPPSGFGMNFDNLVYSTFNMYGKDGTLLHVSDVELTYIINFETGFDDYSINSMLSTDFNAPVPVYEGYKFDGWYLDSDFITPYTTDYKIIEDITLYAKWIPYRTITIISPFDDYTFEPITILEGEVYDLPLFQYPDFEFMGAYTTEDYQNNSQFLTGSIINDDITLYLKFEQINYAKLFSNMLNRMEVLTYVQTASACLLAISILFAVFVRRNC